MLSEEERKATARLAHETINHKDLTLLEGHPGYWETRQIFPLLWTAFPDLISTVERQTIEGEWVTTFTKLCGTHLGTFMGVAPTGKAMEIMHIALDQIVEGKVVEHLAVADWLRALIVFGVVAAPGRDKSSQS